MKIKVCGMREPQNIVDVVALGVDYIGFIFYEQSPRYVHDSLLLWGGVQGWDNTQKVGVFVNHSIDFILEKIKEFGLDLVQLHGQETVEFCKELRRTLPTVANFGNSYMGAVGENTNNGEETLPTVANFGNGYQKIIKVFSVGEEFDFDQLNPYKPFVDYFLFDTKGKNLGGNGTTFDWSILKNYDNEVPFFLSGGIDIQHIEEIKKLRNLNIHALDINSKFEVSAGVKEIGKIKLFIESIKKQNESV
jgi:phosphoribosylanthranilate isomerase